jgi:hypothetical protein
MLAFRRLRSVASARETHMLESGAEITPGDISLGQADFFREISTWLARCVVKIAPRK